MHRMSTIDQLRTHAPLLIPKALDIRRTGDRVSLAGLRIDAGPWRSVIEPLLLAAARLESTRTAGASSLSELLANVSWTSESPTVRASLDRGLASDGRSPQGYAIDIAKDAGAAVTLRAATPEGLRHAGATLVQLLRQYGLSMPSLCLGDEPAMATRGVMLDISRDRVPTMEHLREIVDTLALLKANHLQLYTEHTFAYAGHEEVWRDASPMTGDEYRTLDGWCRELGITLAANQNCFGHLAAWLKRPRYMPLAEIDSLEKVWKFMEWPRPGPFSLCPIDPRSIDLVRDMLGQLLPHFSSRMVNINCDETFDVGQGRSETAVRERGGASVYFDFVDQVLGEVRRHGFKPMFWADIALSHPQEIGRIAPDLLALAWGYEPDSDFDRWGRTLNGAGREFWVCPGTSAWRSVIGRSTERRGNIDVALAAGRRHQASGLLMCDWGDLGHRQQWPVSLHALADGLSGAWTGEARGPHLGAESFQIFGDSSGHTALWLEAIGDCDVDVRRAFHATPEGLTKPLKNASALLQDSTLPWADGHQPGRAAEWREAVARARECESRVPAAASKLVRDELTHTARTATALLERALARRGLLSQDAGLLRARLGDVPAEHRRLWMLRSRPGGLSQSAGHYERLIEDLPHV